MKRHLSYLVVLVIILSGCSKKEDIVFETNVQELNFRELTHRAHIVEIEVLDELTEKNSVFHYNSNDIVNFFSIRKVKVSHIIQSGTLNEGDIIQVLEPVAIDPKSKHVLELNDGASDYVLLKDHKYIVYLDDSPQGDNYSVYNTGKAIIDLKDNSSYSEALMHLTNLYGYSDIISKDSLRSAEESNTIWNLSEPSKTIDVKTKYGTHHIEHTYLENQDATYFIINNTHHFISKGALIIEGSD